MVTYSRFYPEGGAVQGQSPSGSPRAGPQAHCRQATGEGKAAASSAQLREPAGAHRTAPTKGEGQEGAYRMAPIGLRAHGICPPLYRQG